MVIKPSAHTERIQAWRLELSFPFPLSCCVMWLCCSQKLLFILFFTFSSKPSRLSQKGELCLQHSLTNASFFTRPDFSRTPRPTRKHPSHYYLLCFSSQLAEPSLVLSYFQTFFFSTLYFNRKGEGWPFLGVPTLSLKGPVVCSSSVEAD